MTKKIKEEDDYFFPQLPKWITHYGAGLMLILLVSLVVAASSVRYTDKEKVRVVLRKDAQYVELSFDKFRRLTTDQEIQIQGPFDSPVQGYIKKEIIAVKNNIVRVPVIIKDTKDMEGLPIDEQADFPGEYTTSKGSLLSNLF